MKYLAALPIIALLAACGADGEPVRPTYSTTIGVGKSGVHTHTSVGARKGNISVRIGL
jgi:hypothetical protein